MPMQWNGENGNHAPRKRLHLTVMRKAANCIGHREYLLRSAF